MENGTRLSATIVSASASLPFVVRSAVSRSAFMFLALVIGMINGRGVSDLRVSLVVILDEMSPNLSQVMVVRADAILVG